MAFVCLFAFPLVSFRSLAIGLHIVSHVQHEVSNAKGTTSEPSRPPRLRRTTSMPLPAAIGPRRVDPPRGAIGHSPFVILWSPQPNA